MVSCKTKGEIELMRKSGQVTARTIEELKKYLRPGVSGLELDRIADDFIRSQGCEPAFFKLYDFPGHILISFNEEVVHGIPSKRVLKEGDIVSLDVGADYKGWKSDSAATFAVGKVSAEAEKLLRVTEDAMLVGINQMRLGKHVHDISEAVQDYAEKSGYHIAIGGFHGHGIGRQVHEDPLVPNYRQDKRGMALRRGMTLAVEPMVNVGTSEIYVKKDQWTVVTKDGKLSAHFEHSIAVTNGEPYILTSV